ncbi:MAG: chromosomal replication initiator protein DnaA [Holosporales bacterium]|jgi:chromosomal replication initiator protein|nr:chromosomal replication initiator protein DnaA [Holosporales bacterium]
MSVSNVPFLANHWSEVCKKLKGELGNAAFVSWIKPLLPSHYNDDKSGVILTAPSHFIRDWVCNNYIEQIKLAFASVDNRIDDLEIVISENGNAGASGEADSELYDFSKSDPSSAFVENLGSKLDKLLTFDNFVVGKPNELAYAAARRVAEADSVAFNPLFIYGGVGLGKTHLMNAIAWHIKKATPWRKVIYLSAEKFMYRFVKAVRFRDTVAFKEQFRSVDVLMIDDIQFICGKDSTQEEFFHTFNSLVDNNRQVIVSADKSPSDLEEMEERMRSRLGWGLVADIHPANYELRLGILQSKAQLFKVKVPKEVLEFLAHKITSNIREMEGALNRVVASSTLIGNEEISIDMTMRVLKDLLRANNKKITVEDIQRKVADHYSIRLSDIHSPKRNIHIARPRQVAMYFAKQMTTTSLPEIGRKFGGRDHTTVIHAVKKIEELMVTSPEIAEDVRLLRCMLDRD